jgi:hypothetical protein
MHMNNFIFWDMTPCNQAKVNRRFGGTYRLHLQGRSKKLAWNHRCENLKSKWCITSLNVSLSKFICEEDSSYLRAEGWADHTVKTSQKSVWDLRFSMAMVRYYTFVRNSLVLWSASPSGHGLLYRNEQIKNVHCPSAERWRYWYYWTLYYLNCSIRYLRCVQSARYKSQNGNPCPHTRAWRVGISNTNTDRPLTKFVFYYSTTFLVIGKMYSDLCRTGWGNRDAVDLYARGSQFGYLPGHLLWSFSCIFSVPPDRCRVCTSIRLQLFPSKPFPIHNTY